MPIPERFYDALFQEFTCYYEISELPESWDEWMREELDDATRRAAKRMHFRLRGAPAHELVAYLREQATQRHGELAQEIEDWTRFVWSRMDEDWNALNTILLAMAEQLERGEYV